MNMNIVYDLSTNRHGHRKW